MAGRSGTSIIGSSPSSSESLGVVVDEQVEQLEPDEDLGVELFFGVLWSPTGSPRPLVSPTGSLGPTWSPRPLVSATGSLGPLVWSCLVSFRFIMEGLLC